uniref:Receptor kinase n=1 Tax=Solanum tuberosum TaxID=4113 RepID=M1CGZ3_SOLTU
MQLSNFLLLLLSAALMILHRCDARRSTIDGSSKLVDNGETLVSAGENFEMGFFSDDAGLNKYVGIWYYKLSPRTVVWVANWNNSIQGKRIMNEDNSVVVEDGNLKVISNGYTYFSTQLGSGSNRKVELLDTGNLVLVDEGAEMWQSFRNPTDTFLPGMKMDSSLNLTDSKYENYIFRLDQASDKEYVIVLPKQGKILWKGSAESGKLSFSEMPGYVAYLLSNSTNNSLESIGTFNKYRLLMNSSGEIQFYGWDKEISGWSLRWSAPNDKCDWYKYCGKFSICNSKREPVCKCLPGYKLNPPDNSKAGEFSGGCSSMSVSSCNEDNVEVLDTFLDLRSMKFKSPDRIFSNNSTREDCRRICLGNCKCQAYTYHDSVCRIWVTSLMYLQENYAGGFNISVRVSISDIGNFFFDLTYVHRQFKLMCDHK